jgi:hypothetical protein
MANGNHESWFDIQKIYKVDVFSTPFISVVVQHITLLL